MKITNQGQVAPNLTFKSNLNKIIRASKELEKLEETGTDISQLQQIAEKINSRFEKIPLKTGNTSILKKYGKLQNSLTRFYLDKISPKVSSLIPNEKVNQAQIDGIKSTFKKLLGNAQSLYGRTPQSKELSVHRLIIGTKRYRYDDPKLGKILGFED